MNRWSDKQEVIEEIMNSSDTRRLTHILLDQQFDGWYDPCGKSGYDLNQWLSRLSVDVISRIREIADLPKVKLEGLTLDRTRRSDNVDGLLSVVVALTDGDELNSPLSRTAAIRLKDLLWHGRKFNTNPLDALVDALGLIE